MGNLIFVLTLVGLAILAFGAFAKFRGKSKEAELAGDLRRIVDQLVGAIESYSQQNQDATLKGMVRERVAPDSRAGRLLDERIDVVTGRWLRGPSKKNFSTRKARPTEKEAGAWEARLAICLLPLLCFQIGCGSFNKSNRPIDNLLTNIGEGHKFGSRVVLGPDGAPAQIDGEAVNESLPGFEIEFWNNAYNDEGNQFWSDNLVSAASNALAAAVGFVDPWAGVAMIATNAGLNNLMLPATADIFVPEYFVGNRVRVRISGEAVAAGGQAEGNTVSDTSTDYVGSNLEHKPYSWWVLFRPDLTPEEMALIEKLSE